MRSDTQQPFAFRILARKEIEILEAIADRIFPKTDTPGAVEIGAVEYIDIALAGDYAPLLPLYRQGLRVVDRYACAKYRRPFSSLSSDEQDTVLIAFESGRIETYAKAAEFLETVRYHVMEGVFCEPHYGGNKDMIGWRLVGFPGQQWGYADAYINRPVDLDPVAISPQMTEKKSS